MDNKYVPVCLRLSLNCFMTHLAKSLQELEISCTREFWDKANVKEFGYRSNSTSLSPIRQLKQLSSLRSMPITALKDFLQPCVLLLVCLTAHLYAFFGVLHFDAYCPANHL